MPAALDFGKLDFSKLLRDVDETSAFKEIQDRAKARVMKYQPITPAERLAAFESIGYTPHGLYVPYDDDIKNQLIDLLSELGEIDDDDKRLFEYKNLQKLTESWQLEGIDGRWSGQQAIARSVARYRLAAMGRRSGKTYHAAREVIAVVKTKPRAVVTIVAPTMRLVSRCFDMVHELLIDLGFKLVKERDTDQVKLLQLDNGAVIEGQSADNVMSLAGTAVDLAVGDEAAQFVPDTWERGIQPTLADKKGHALLISSYEGQGDFFETKAVEAEARQKSGGPVLWAYFRGPSWDNFFAFPQGRKSQAIVEAEQDTTDRANFLEQFGAIPAGAKERVYPEYKDRVHVERLDFDPDWPYLYATADPSSGSNEYSVAIIQDFPDGKCRQHPNHIDHCHIIDEFYETHVSAKQIHPILARRPWYRPRIEMLVDPASPDQAREWGDLGWTALVFVKPEIRESIPVVRNQLCDPFMYHHFYQARLHQVATDLGIDPTKMDETEEAEVLLHLEERLANQELTEEDVAALKAMSHVFVDSDCVNTQIEFKMYSYPKRRNVNANVKENPRDYKNHLMDCIRYWMWEKKRLRVRPGQDRVYLADVGRASIPDDLPVPHAYIPPVTTGGDDRRGMFIETMREHHSLQIQRNHSYLQPVENLW